jgi:hypothetical protein
MAWLKAGAVIPRWVGFPEAALLGDGNERAQLCELSSTLRFLASSGAAAILID